MQPPPPVLFLSVSTKAGLKLPFHCGQRFTLAGPAKSPEKSGLVKKGDSVFCRDPHRKQEQGCSVLFRSVCSSLKSSFC